MRSMIALMTITLALTTMSVRESQALSAAAFECQKAFAREGQTLNTAWHDGTADCLNRILGTGPTAGVQSSCASRYTAMETQRERSIVQLRSACSGVTDIDELGGPICDKAHIDGDNGAIFCILDDAQAHARESILSQYHDPCETLGLVNMEAGFLADYCP
ncbi:MAG: hypothetical protein AAB367_00040 [Patescibacteria group bacterium]